MGEEIGYRRFTERDFHAFAEKLGQETELLIKWLDGNSSASADPAVGFELETWLIDKNFQAAPVNEPFLKTLKNPAVVHELSRFNVELNSSPLPLRGGIFSKLQKELEGLWRECQSAAEKLQAEMIMIGILPTLRPDMLTLKNMSVSQRYAALNEQILKQREGRPLQLDIQGPDRLKISHDNVMLESTATSLQIHVNVPPAKAADFYNTALILSAPMVALTANSPCLFQKRLWDETRIPVFEQAVQLNEFPDKENFPVGRVTLGSGFLRESFAEIFRENLEKYPTLLPILFSDSPEQLKHLRLHNGTIWRWNRPLIGDPTAEAYPLRLEHRVAAAGPSIPDVLANVAFFSGLIYAMSLQDPPPATKLTFHHARENFYRAAQHGFNAEVIWLGGKKGKIRDLLLQELIPLAAGGLERLNVAPHDIRHFIAGVVKNRVEKGLNGATWQRKFLEKNKNDFLALTQAYVNQQRGGRPVHEWSL